MNFNKYTVKAQEAIQAALDLASTRQHQAIEPEHVMRVFLSDAQSIPMVLLRKLGIPMASLETDLDRSIARLPIVTGTAGNSQYMSTTMNAIFDQAQKLASKMGDEYVSTEHLLMALLETKSQVSSLLSAAGVTKEALNKAIQETRGSQKVDDPHAESRYQALKRYARDLNDLAEKNKLDPVIGRDNEIRRVMQILSRRTKNNPVLIGEPGVGKTAIAEGLALRIVKGDVPEGLRTKRVMALDMGALVAGAKYRGEFEDRLKAVVKEVTDSDGEILLFIDEIHTLVGAGATEGAMDAANILKPSMARGDMHVIGATTLTEYRKYIEKDKALERRMQTVLVGEPSVEDTVSILRGLKERYEVHHGVRITDSAIVAAAELSHRYITGRFLPDKAIDLIDEAASRLRIEIDSMPEELDDIDRQIRQLEIEREALKREQDSVKLDQISKELANLTEKMSLLKTHWIHEKELIQKSRSLKEAIETARYEADKAERASNYERVAELRYGTLTKLTQELEQTKQELELIQRDRSMLKEEVDAEDVADIVAKWTGIPVKKMLQGERAKLLHLEEELGRRVIGQRQAIEAVSNAVRRARVGLQDASRPIGSFIFMGSTGVGKTELARSLADYLFNDEHAMIRIDMSEYMEKHSVSRLIGAPPGYVGYEEGGQLTEAVRRRPYAVVLLDEIEKAHPDVFNVLLQVLDDGRLTDNKGVTVDFTNTVIIMTSNIGSHLVQQKIESTKGELGWADYVELQGVLMEHLRQVIRPEFLNRVDDIIVFHPLSQQHLRRIVEVQLDKVYKMLERNRVKIRLSDSVKDWLAVKGYHPSYGARPLKRLIQSEITNNLARLLLSRSVEGPAEFDVQISSDGESLRFVEVFEDIAAWAE